MRGKPWTRDEEDELKHLITKGEPAEYIANQLGKTTYSVYQKARRLGFNLVVDGTKSDLTSSTIQLPPELPTPEEALKMLAGALKAATQPGLTKVEVDRLQVVATLARTYDHLLANYTRYREIESKLMELEHKYAQLAQKTKNNAPTPNETIPTEPSTH
jgi:hypothetical protein